MPHISLNTAADAQTGIKKGLSLRRNFSWTLAGNVIYAGCQWGILVVLAKLGTPDSVGQFALGLAVAAPVFMFANLNLRAVQATDAKNSFCFEDYFKLRVVMTSLAAILILIIIFFTKYKVETALVVLAVAGSKSVEALSDAFYGLFQKNESMNVIGKSMILRGILSLTAMFLGFLVTRDVFFATLSLVFAKIIIFFFYDYPNGKRFTNGKFRLFASKNISSYLHSLKTSKNIMKNLTLLSLPLGIVTMLNSLNTNIPRYLIEKFNGEHDLGIFAAMAYLMVAGTAIVSALGQAASPRLAKYYSSQGSLKFVGLLVKLVGIGAVVGISGIFIIRIFGKEILSILYRKEYSQYNEVFLFIMIASCLSYISSFLGVAITSARHFKVQVPIAIASLLVVSISSYFLIPVMGIMGAAISIINMFIVQIPIKIYVISHALRNTYA